ncbi:Mitochondrial distribution and morphology protein 12, partial [Elasticomyces elasticus]
ILSASPFVKFEPPYLLMRAREMERRLAYLRRLRDQDAGSEESTEEKTKTQKFILITPEMVHKSPQNAPPKVKEVLRAAHDAEYDRALHHYMTQKRHWETYVSGSNSNLFDPYAHQNIVVLFSLVYLALRIHYDQINLLEIIVPRTRVTWKVDNDLRLRNEVYLRMEQRLAKFMLSVKARLKGINVESVVPSRVEECQKEIESLNKKANDDQTGLIRQLQEKYTNSRYWELIPLNVVLRSVQEKVVEWDVAFVEFEKNYFPSEKDIRRLATLQLKKIASIASWTGPEEPTTAPPEREDMAEESDRPLLMRRMTLSPEKAQDVLVSVVEEHSGKKKIKEKELSE